MFGPFKKERPVQGLTGMGGGAGGYLVGGGGASNDPTGHVASGGVISDYATPTAAYRAHIFHSSGSFVISELSSAFPAHVEYLVVGGGAGGGGAGGGSQASGGGGGAGGYKSNVPGPAGPGGSPNSPAYVSGYPVSAATFPVVVGRGGERGQNSVSAVPSNPNAKHTGGNGYASYFGPPTVRVQAEGGGRGGAGRGDTPGNAPGGDGGSGGGAGFTGPGPSWGGTGNREAVPGSPAPGPGQGYGSSSAGRTGPTYSGPGCAGGGSGAGGLGGDAAPTYGGAGGAGKDSVIAYGPTIPLFYSGGGGGGNAPPNGSSPQPAGGSSVGGNGSRNNFDSYSTDAYAVLNPLVDATSRRANSGSGGGGGGVSGNNINGPGGNGSFGTVVIRYQIGQSEATASAKATGGAVSYYNDKIIHCFLHTQTFVTTSAITGAEVVCLGGGGGGGGGNAGAGGGGAGALCQVTSVAFDNSCTYTATVGEGGQGGYQGNYRGNNGVDSTLAYTSGGPSPAFLGTITAKGGGYGGGWGPTVRDGGPGGCGGGGNGGNGGGSIQAPVNPSWPAPQITNQINSGGNGHQPTHRGGGGGGTGGGGSWGDSSGPRNGGHGSQLPTTFRDPAAANALGVQGPDSSYYWVGGGGGGGCESGSPNAQEPSALGKGGGGPGSTGPWSGGGQGGSNTGPYIATPTSGHQGCPGSPNTGGGGGGGWWDASTGYSGGNGGPGMILIAYPK